MNTPLVRDLLSWYMEHARSLPWRGLRDPYAIWVSEIMLQQTRVETVIPYFERWIARFPTIEALTRAEREDVLRLWEGLGYYRRALNLHRAARVLLKDHEGRLPETRQALEDLPGIGKYTAAAIGALAFHQDVLALDGNLRRVLARLMDLALDTRTPRGEKTQRDWGEAHLPNGRGSDFNQALMDLGASVCLPRAPRCPACPLQAHCLAFQRGTQGERPVRAPRKRSPHHTVAAAVLWEGGEILIARRPEGGLLGGLWEFPGGKREAGETLPSCLRRELGEELDIDVEVGAQIGVFEHAYTHFRVSVYAFHCHIVRGEPNPCEHEELAWVSPTKLGAYPMGKIDRAIAQTIAAGDPGPPP